VVKRVNGGKPLLGPLKLAHIVGTLKGKKPTGGTKGVNPGGHQWVG